MTIVGSMSKQNKKFQENKNKLQSGNPVCDRVEGGKVSTLATRRCMKEKLACTDAASERAKTRGYLGKAFYNYSATPNF
jgi:hypothetical protein